LDLIEVAPTAVLRLPDHRLYKYKYDQQKKERKVKKHQHVTHLKQIRIKPHIDDHDWIPRCARPLLFK